MSDLAEESVVLTLGSLHYDILVEARNLPRKDETAIGKRWYPKFGGKGGNQAAAVARAGVASRMLGAVGGDDFGKFLRAELVARGVSDRFVATLPGEASGMSVAVQDPAGDYVAAIVSGANLKIDPAGLMAEALWQGVGLLVLQSEVAQDLNLAAAKMARQRGIQVLWNAAPAREAGSDMEPWVDLLVVNAVEASMMGAGSVADLTGAGEAAGRLARNYPSAVVTAGAHGLALALGKDVVLVPAEPVKVVSTHGAGDAFVGALAAEILRGLGLEAACRSAAKAAGRFVAGDFHA